MAIILIDANGLAMRAKHAKLSKDEREVPAHAKVYDCFIRYLAAIGRQTCSIPEQTFLIWDGGHSQKRKELVPEYKANRGKKDETPEEFAARQLYYQQVQRITTEIESLGYRSIRVTDVEADDIISIYTHELVENTAESVVIVSEDTDFHQLWGFGVDIFSYYTGWQSKETLVKRWGFSDFTLLPAYKAIVGDSSDNITGVAGVGPKKALDILPYVREILAGTADFSRYPSNVQKTAAKVTENLELVQRNIKAILLPKRWNTWLYSSEQMEEARRQIDRNPRDLMDYGKFCRFLRENQVEQLGEVVV
jgi:5'-3' exonuclease